VVTLSDAVGISLTRLGGVSIGLPAQPHTSALAMTAKI
jgi:hypothetical protein